MLQYSLLACSVGLYCWEGVQDVTRQHACMQNGAVLVRVACDLVEWLVEAGSQVLALHLGRLPSLPHLLNLLQNSNVSNCCVITLFIAVTLPESSLLLVMPVGVVQEVIV